MAFKNAERVKETSVTTGTGTYNLDGAVTGFRTFVAGIGTTNTCHYCAENGTDWEIGVGTVTDAAPDTLARTTILASSNAGSAVSWAAGSKNLFSTPIPDYPIKRFAGTTIAMGEFVTWLVLAANSGSITGTTPVTVMTITGVGIGRYHFRCQLIYQTTAATTGIDIYARHTGTATAFVAEHRFTSTGGAAATAAATASSTVATGNIYEAQGTRQQISPIGAGTVSVDTINVDMMSTIEGYFIVTVTGSLEIRLAAEAASLVCTAREGSFLELEKLS